MTRKDIIHPELGKVLLSKRRGQKHIRISLKGDNTVRITMPSWLPYASGLSYLESKKQWIIQQQAKLTRPKLTDGSLVGKRHVVSVEPSVRDLRVSVQDGLIRLYLPEHMSLKDEDAQLRLQKGLERALKKEGEDYLPERLRILSERYRVSYKSCYIKRLKSRWGSCDQHKNIILNSFLMTLPEHLIDYVLLHELTHTKHMNHQTSFWQELHKICPSYLNDKKEIKQYQPHL